MNHAKPGARYIQVGSSAGAASTITGPVLRNKLLTLVADPAPQPQTQITGARPDSAAPASSNSKQERFTMKQKHLGSHGPAVSSVGPGRMGKSRTAAPVDLAKDAESIATIQSAIDRGISWHAAHAGPALTGST